jgi:hypothetical protein
MTAQADAALRVLMLPPALAPLPLLLATLLAATSLSCLLILESPLLL